MSVRDCFGRLYGPDLIRTLKEGPAYYARIFADAGVDPVRSLVVDDTPLALRWAAEVGARTLLVGEASPEFRTIAALADLPALIDALADA